MQRFPTFAACPVCGDPAVNPGALAVTWYWDEPACTVKGLFTPDGRHTGYAGRMHGGLVSSLLDEAMAWACAVERGSYCVTGELKVRFKSSAPLGEQLEVRGRVVGDAWGPYLKATGELIAPDGRVVATGSAVFSALPRDESLAMREALRFEPGDLDVLA
ncbi:MAG: PaaI family thioesterase [Acidobacteria bacterium]|nr:PaaI family thioesterase [Acidobacteriota bacterium]